MMREGMFMRRILKSYFELLKTEGCYIDVNGIVRFEDSSILGYSKPWIDANEGKTEEEIRESQISVDGYDITLHEGLFVEVENGVATWSMSCDTKDETFIMIRDVLLNYDGLYGSDWDLESMGKDKLIRVIHDLAGLIDETRDLALLGWTRTK